MRLFFLRLVSLLLFLTQIASIPARAYQAQDLTRLINEGTHYHSNRNYLLAIKSFQAALDLDPTNKQVLESLSIAHNNYGKYLNERTDGLGALREFRTSLYFDPSNDIARSNLNVKLKNLGYSVDNPTARLKQADFEKRSGNFFAAIAELREINRLQPQYDAYIKIAEVYHVLFLRSLSKSLYAERAFEALDQAIGMDRNDVRAYIKKGDVYVAQNAVSKAVDQYEKAIKLDPHNRLAQDALINGWLASIRVAPHLPNNHVGLATAYQIKGDYLQAERSFQKALQLDPNNKFAKSGLESLQEDKRKSQIALYLERALKAQEAKSFDESLGYYVRALNLDPNDADIHYNIGTAFQSKNDILRAKRAYNKTLELNPNHQEAKEALAKIESVEQEINIAEAFDYAVKLQEKGEYQRAIEIYNKIMNDRPEDDTLYFNLGTAYQAIGDTQSAHDNYLKAYELNPEPSYKDLIGSSKVDLANSILEEGITQQTAGNNEAAISSYKRVIALVSDNASAWYNLGTAYQALDQTGEALDAYEQAYELDEANQPEAIFFAAVLHEEKRNLLKAIELYEKYMSLMPGGPYAASAKERQEYIKSFL